ncbi:Lysophospholipase L1 [Acetitomaculum ruminis DSM 5522]|uniref:Lysophospholipase L1 n=1 Tax=Acetitomaculum ruminis DSM 5522 TaxID=1120918 RepID=A0A1I0X1H7_9FIRM|nr:GDSL-type esterase/lipase family protein [Acetitomaculum ruminis]SFA93963.1 Lysophospholipase L1 [Acetitomaculum ruminis DSM 5522]
MGKLVFLGDSVTNASRFWVEKNQGLGEGFVYMIGEELDRKEDIINKGYDGLTSMGLISKLSYIFDDIGEESIEKITLCIGINDILESFYKQIPAYKSGYLQNLKDIVKRLKDMNITKDLLIMSPFLFTDVGEYRMLKGYVEEFVDTSRYVAHSHSLDYLDLDQIFKKQSQISDFRTLTTDGVHPSRKGHRIIADSWLKQFRTKTKES